MRKLYLSEKPKHVLGYKRQIPLYPCELYVGVGDDDFEGGITYLAGKSIWVIIHKDHVRNYGIIAHEAVHVVEYVGEIVGEQLKGEANAYLTQWVVDTTIELLTRRKKNGKRKHNNK